MKTIQQILKEEFLNHSKLPKKTLYIKSTLCEDNEDPWVMESDGEIVDLYPPQNEHHYALMLFPDTPRWSIVKVEES